MGAPENILAVYGRTPALLGEEGPLVAAELVAVAERLGTSPYWLANLIYAESGWSARAANPSSKATGLIQFMPKTALGLGTTVDALKAMTAAQQLPFVERYLKPYAPLSTEQALYLAVFQPVDRLADPYKQFPSYVWRANPWTGGTLRTWTDSNGVLRMGRYITTPADYVRFVRSRSKMTPDGHPQGALAAPMEPPRSSSPPRESGSSPTSGGSAGETIVVVAAIALLATIMAFGAERALR